MAKSCGAAQPGADRFSYPFNKALEGLTVPRDMFGGDEQKFSSKSHLGSARAKLCQIQDGRWKSVTDYITEM